MSGSVLHYVPITANNSALTVCAHRLNQARISSAGGDAEFQGRRFALKCIRTEGTDARAAALAEVHALGIATLDKHMQHCVVPLLAYADAGTEVRIVMAQPSTSLASVMAEYADQPGKFVRPGGASKLESWVRGAFLCLTEAVW